MNKFLSCALALFFLAASFLFWKGKPAAPVYAPVYAEEEQKSIFLTFDDGPSDRVTPKILDVLQDKGVNATFFIVGSHAAIRGALTRRIAAEGNSIGIHSYSHDYKEIYASPAALLADIEKCGRVLESLGIYTRLYRFPGGSHMVGEEFSALVKKKGYRYADWNAVCGDSEMKDPTVEQLFKRAVSSAGDRKNIVLLCHDTTDKLAVAHALPLIIDYYQNENYHFCTFDMI